MSLFEKKASDSDTDKAMDAVVEPASTEQDGTSKTAPRTPLTHKLWAKVVAFMLTILTAGLAVGSVIAAVFMIDQEVYTTSEWSHKQAAFENLAEADAHALVMYLRDGSDDGEHAAARYLSDRNIASVEMVFSEGPRKNWGYDGGKTEGNYGFEITLYHRRDHTGSEWYSPYNPATADTGENTPTSTIELLGTVDVSITLSNNFQEQDEYLLCDRLFSLAYDLRYAVYGIGAISAVLAILCFIFLLIASGRRKGCADPQPGWGTKVPFDLLVVGTVLVLFIVFQLGLEAIRYGSSSVIGLLLFLLATMAAVVAGLGLCMSFALRIKLGGWWKNTVVFYGLRLCWYLLRKLGGCFRFIGHGIAVLFRGIPLVWKTALLIVVLCIYNFFALLIGIHDGGWLVILLGLEVIILIPAVMYAALMLRKLYQSSQALAAGDLSYQIDTKHMVWDFKRAAENLNSIGCGMTCAVEERTKSERMKTELINNVYHDIKTPLTSIINYSDLIEREPCDNEKITEYAGVLHRQSERLKRLIDDLVEVSKASTGNLEVLLGPCELNVLLTQTAGEYMQRMEGAGLELITQMPEEDIRVLGDGRRMWRVFDNLANNACKYAMPGTRIYITLQKENGMALVAFKNTSRLPLNISADELMERFVRGDAARHTDGNGLGLSIARSLTELQKGSLQLSIDGDFFKVELRFPLI